MPADGCASPVCWEAEVSRSKHVYVDGQRVAITALVVPEAQQSNAEAQINAALSVRQFFHNDPVGSTALLTNQSGERTQEIDYFPFGEELFDKRAPEDQNLPQEYRFDGKELDPETGLQYFGVRYYDPRIARWISADPLYRTLPGIGLANPKNLNLFTFGLNNPVVNRDQNGMQGQKAEAEISEPLKHLLVHTIPIEIVLPPVEHGLQHSLQSLSTEILWRLYMPESPVLLPHKFWRTQKATAIGLGGLKSVVGAKAFGKISPWGILIDVFTPSPILSETKARRTAASKEPLDIARDIITLIENVESTRARMRPPHPSGALVEQGYILGEFGSSDIWRAIGIPAETIYFPKSGQLVLPPPLVEQGIEEPGGVIWFPKSRRMIFPPIEIKLTTPPQP
jgi:RHS repeat-associated protein